MVLKTIHGQFKTLQTSLRSIVGEMDLDDALSSRDHIKAKLKAAISDDISDWGITLKLLKFKIFSPLLPCKLPWSSSCRRTSTPCDVTRADGEKQAAILEADGRLKRLAVMQSTSCLAEASQKPLRW